MIVIPEFKRIANRERQLKSQISAYERAQVPLISTVVGSKREGGLSDVVHIRDMTDLPLLVKGHIKAHEYKAMKELGATHVLIIQGQSNAQLQDLDRDLRSANEQKIGVVAEVSSVQGIARCMAARVEYIAVNSRAIHSREPSLIRHGRWKLLESVPRNVTAIAASGISNPDHVELAKENRADAILVGTHLMKVENPQLVIEEWKEL